MIKIKKKKLKKMKGETYSDDADIKIENLSIKYYEFGYKPLIEGDEIKLIPAKITLKDDSFTITDGFYDKDRLKKRYAEPEEDK